MNHFKKIAGVLEAHGLDAVLLTCEANRFYASGFHSTGTDGVALVTREGNFYFTDSRYIEAARAALAGIAQVLLCSREAPMRTLVQGILREANVQLLGGEEQTTSYAEFTAYEQLLGLKLQPEQSILRTGSGIHSLRLRKECAVHSGVILLDTGICNVNGFVGASGIRGFFFNGLRFVYRGNVSTTVLNLLMTPSVLKNRIGWETLILQQIGF